jgi:hypothetical protein
MRKIRDVIRLALGEGLSLREVGESLDLPFTTVGDHRRRAVAAGLTWPLPAELDDRALEALLFPPVTPSNVARPMPDWAHIHAELRRKGVTLELLWLEYREQHPIAHWHEALGDATIADAVLDRLLERAHRIELVGDSMRRNEATAKPSK